MENVEKPGFFKRLGLGLKDFFNPKEWVKTLRSVPSMVLALITVAMILMNVLANKAIIELPIPNTDTFWLIQDAGVMLSWVGFLAGDLLTKNFGAKHAIRVNITALLLSLFVSALLALVSITPGSWSPEFAYDPVADAPIIEAINQAINEVMGNTWYVILGSAAASVCGLVINNLTQDLILKKIEAKHGNHYWGYLTAAAASSFFGQIIDNLVFAALISVHFFQWSWGTAFMCSLDGAILEIVLEMLFTPLTFAISKNWDKNHIGVKWMKLEAQAEEVK